MQSPTSEAKLRLQRLKIRRRSVKVVNGTEKAYSQNILSKAWVDINERTTNFQQNLIVSAIDSGNQALHNDTCHSTGDVGMMDLDISREVCVTGNAAAVNMLVKCQRSTVAV